MLQRNPRGSDTVRSITIQLQERGGWSGATNDASFTFHSLDLGEFSLVKVIQ